MDHIHHDDDDVLLSHDHVPHVHALHHARVDQLKALLYLIYPLKTVLSLSLIVDATFLATGSKLSPVYINKSDLLALNISFVLVHSYVNLSLLDRLMIPSRVFHQFALQMIAMDKLSF